MGAGGASTGGGNGGVGPAGSRVSNTGVKTYGTAKDAKKTQSRNEFRTFVKDGGITGAIIKGITGKTPYETNLERRQKFIQKKGLTGDDINMDVSYIGSKEGLAELRKQGYTTASDNINIGNGNGNNNNTPAPTILKKTAGGQTVQTTAPTEAELSQSAAADAEAYDLRKTKKRGRSMTRLRSTKSVDDKLTLGKPSLLGA